VLIKTFDSRVFPAKRE